MIDPGNKLSIQKQARLLKVSRSSVYYKPRPISAEDLKLMRQLDELHMDYPFAGSRLLRDLLGRIDIYPQVQPSAGQSYESFEAGF